MWTIKINGYNANNNIHYGNQFLIGSLKIGVRGTLDEFTKEQLVAVNLPLVYDQVGDLWRESVNAFNPLYTSIEIDGHMVDVINMKPVKHEQWLDLKTATMHRRTSFNVDGNEVTIFSSRFVDSNHERLIVGKYNIHMTKPAILTVETGIDLNVWDINGPHLEQIKTYETENTLTASSITHEAKKHIKVLKTISYDKTNTTEIVKNVDDKILKVINLKVEANKTFSFEQFAHVGIDEDQNQNLKMLSDISKTGYEKLWQTHSDVWKQKWFHSDIELTGHDEAQLALRYSIYQLLLLAPNDFENASIPARGISGQTYKGAIFWDTEIFMLPFYLNTDLVSAKQIINYRINSLDGALEKAKSYGFKGAFYAWESHENGYDACSDYNVTDVFTNRKLRTYFKDKQIHISADVIYALKQYLERTKDYDILTKGGLKVLLEVSRFYLDYGNYKVLTDTFELWDVMGPDEYHERVHNNAFTNQMVKMVFELVLTLEAHYSYNHDHYFEKLIKELDFENELKLIKKYVNKIKIIKPNNHNIIEQFDGYFKLKDVNKEDILKEKLHPNEYLGGQGLFGDTQIIKQADVITMLYLFKDLYTLDVLKDNFYYYEPRTEHGSSLSASMYALVACMMKNPDYAWPHFIKSATADLTGDTKQFAGSIYIGGTHPAAAGGAFLTAVYGFAGLKFVDDKPEVKPVLPTHIKSLKFRIIHQNKQYEIFVSRDKNMIKEVKDHDN